MDVEEEEKLTRQTSLIPFCSFFVSTVPYTCRAATFSENDSPLTVRGRDGIRGRMRKSAIRLVKDPSASRSRRAGRWRGRMAEKG